MLPPAASYRTRLSTNGASKLLVLCYLCICVVVVVVMVVIVGVAVVVVVVVVVGGGWRIDPSSPCGNFQSP